ncbi:hypothetical protein LJC36_06205 [Desulfovibrio sp. OttesenSCG-928-C14]|nr:hypothetical protein [Desulfovibrio sp. OttesenSCG-928-C14]
MTEKEKMLAGEIYDCGDPELMDLWVRGKNLMQAYNAMDYGDRAGQLRILDELLGARGIRGPVRHHQGNAFSL